VTVAVGATTAQCRDQLVGEPTPHAAAPSTARISWMDFGHIRELVATLIRTQAQVVT
jgi:hypothetical protein